jgi:hypothetical protein
LFLLLLQSLLSLQLPLLSLLLLQEVQLLLTIKRCTDHLKAQGLHCCQAPQGSGVAPSIQKVHVEVREALIVLKKGGETPWSDLQL